MTSFLISAKIAFAVFAQVFVVTPACIAHAWTEPTYSSIKPYPDVDPGKVGKISRPLVDEWKWNWLNTWYANPEDGVSGQQAYIWDANGHMVPYASGFRFKAKWWVALCWNARNNANNIKRPYRDDSLNKPWSN